MEAGGGGASSLPPFLSKTYEMVDDPATDAVVAWTPPGTSFVVANQAEFCRDLLPKYFKHNNFSSFVRQLNTYGFRKIDPEQWEFANEDFIRGQQHRLKNIHRRKPIFSHSSHTGSGPLADTERRDYEEEIERLKSDNAALTSELENNAQKKLVTEKRMQDLEDKLIFLEDRQKNLMAYVRDIVQAPGFLASFVQQPDHHGKKRRLPIPISLHQDANTEGNQIVHGGLTDPPACRESFDKMESSLNSLESFLREASEAFNISYDDGLPGPSSAVVITELHSSGESDPHVPSPVSRMHTSSAGAETGLSRDQPVEEPPHAATGVNDGFWQQFLTEQPGSDAHQEAQSERRDGDDKGDQTRIGDREKFWWGKKNVEQMTEKLGHLTSVEKT
ncbi:hypothetical protein SORBI_3003G295900 [Sorghum bicolor]|uniref:HSF-type DNA-binding domain-containing protein n=1 Tax=Sorghum bicolor TaxID=4558 RepID=A0A1W0VZI6_SORBI|nr:hypothetical protein SORBI_3003G295900 [Sorghum bicolor]